MLTKRIPRTGAHLRLLAVLAVGAVIVAACGSGASSPASRAATDQTFGPVPADAGTPTKGEAGGNTSTAFKDDAKIVRTGTLQLQVERLEEAIAAARQAIVGLNGYVSASRQSNTGDQPVAEITYRIPSDRWDDALTAIRALGTKVLYEQTDAVEVTGQLVDLDARIKNLQASETALLAIQAKADKIADVLEVEARLSDVRGQIEQLQGQRTLLADQVSYGTLTVTYGTEIAAITQATRQWDPASEFDRAVAALVNVAQGVANGAIWFAIVWIPAIVALLFVAFVIRRVARRAGWKLPELGGPRASDAAAETPGAGPGTEPPATA